MLDHTKLFDTREFNTWLDSDSVEKMLERLIKNPMNHEA